jgi:hypothetical protein
MTYEDYVRWAKAGSYALMPFPTLTADWITGSGIFNPGVDPTKAANPERGILVLLALGVVAYIVIKKL